MATTPPLSDWSIPSQFLNEIIGLRNYLIKMITKIEKHYIKISELIIDAILICLKQVRKVVGICNQPDAMNSPLFGVFIFDFNTLSQEIIDEIKLKSENYSNELDYENLLENLTYSMKKNIFLVNETTFIESNEGSSNLRNSFENTKSYMKIGEILKDSEKALKLKQELATLRSQGDGETSYYASIVGPSFLGKTQTAFILSHHMTVFYVNLLSTFDTGNVEMQPIYRETSEFSRLFLQTIQSDMIKIEKNSCSSNAHDLLHSRLEFETLGLLYVLIHDQKLNPNLSVEERFLRCCKISQVTIPKLKVPDFNRKIRGNRHLK